MPTGCVKWFQDQKGYGFLKIDGEEREVFVHYSDIVSDTKFKSLSENDRVEFEIIKGDKGFKAQKVKRLA